MLCILRSRYGTWFEKICRTSSRSIAHKKITFFLANFEIFFHGIALKKSHLYVRIHTGTFIHTYIRLDPRENGPIHTHRKQRSYIVLIHTKLPLPSINLPLYVCWYLNPQQCNPFFFIFYVYHPAFQGLITTFGESGPGKKAAIHGSIPP